MFHNNRRGQYTVLELEDGSEGSRDSEREDTLASQPNQTPIRWLIITCLISLVISTLNLSITALWEPPARPFKFTSSVKPRFPSVYIGLERLNVSQRILDMPPVMNYPMLISSVSERDPGEVDRNGTVVQIDGDHSSVMQFRVHDYGLERCTLNVTIPSPSELGHKPYLSSSNSQAIQVWRLADTDSPLRPRTLSWRTKPARVTLMGTLNFAPGTSSYLPWFSCKSNSLQAFEFSCPDCSVRFKQDHAAPLLGVMMYQIHT
ncbi:hypothetical protein NEOLEDRAFT_537335 [Neolentinus lepideus HHB14362 ss-1]|uniref:Ubiquitin 3 binding protein But2 C-terminal domain-containing protein n=1 Tax=Neolentinus lepideus HHB14362 ss-1 TaxID=1314782 RepID=A0A165RBA5_9AGAM|nr:hypothetical protein NEOLEDRAFT_537335 [Neolentinus lepideus HHB14362 ss-1]